MFELLKSSLSRKAFVALAGAVGFIAFSSAVAIDISRQRISLSDGLLGGAEQLLYGGAGAILGAGLVLLVFRLFHQTEERLNQVECLDPSQTAKQHDEALSTTDFWYHDGHIARWVRTSAVTALTKTAMRGAEKDIKALIIDPRNGQMVQEYANYRSRIGYKEPRFVSVDDTIQEILATAIIFQICHESNKGIKVELHFRNYLTNSRIDISSSRAFRTLVDPRVPAAVYYNPKSESRTSFYHALREEFSHQLAVAKKFDFLPTSGLNQDRLTATQVRSYLQTTGLSIGRNDEYYREIVRRVRSTFNGVRGHG
jgi:hypothetical protein